MAEPTGTEPVVGAPATEPGLAAAVQPPAITPTPDSTTPLGTLHALFPDTTLDVLEAVLDAHHGSIEGATETLLSMTDPNFVPDPPSHQLNTDEELARQLQEEDDLRSSASRARPPQSRSAPSLAPGELPYKPYVSRKARQGGANPPVPPKDPQAYSSDGTRGKDELDQLAEQFSSLAEQGKKTLGGLFSKVKEQINKTASPSTSASAEITNEKVNRPWTPPSSRSASAANTSSYASSSVVPELLPRPEGVPPLRQPPATTPSTTASSAAPPSTELSAISATATGGEVTPPAVSEEPKKDFSKIGLLPREAISLEPASKGKAAGHESDEDSEDLEYVKSPFDDD